MSNNDKNTFVVFFDSVGRTILGERLDAETTDELLVIKNPAVVHILPNQQTGQLQLQILPLFFKEFLADKNDSTIWKYKRNSITESNDITFDFKLQAQYQQLFAAGPIPAPQGQPQGQPAGSETDVVKLFDE